MGNATLLYDVTPELVVLVHGDDHPSGADWEGYLAALGKLGAIPRSGVLVVTDGAGPSPTQREAMNTRYAVQVRVAVVTASPVARGMVTVLSWFNKLIRAFPPPAIRDALAYLQVDASRHDEVVSMVGAMRLRLAGEDVDSSVAGSALLREQAIAPMEAVVTRLSKLRGQIAGRRGPDGK